MPDLPITAKLLPTSASNLMYLAEVAVLTRVVTGILRVLENRPSKQTDPRLSLNEKRQALFERSYVELFGTAIYIGCLHLGQDAVNKMYNRLDKLHLDPTALREDAKHLLHQYTSEVEHLDNKVKQALEQNFDDGFHNALKKTFGIHQADGSVTLENAHENMIARRLYGETVNETVNGKVRRVEHPKADLVTFKKNFMEEMKGKTTLPALEDKKAVEEAFEAIVKSKPLQEFARKTNVGACKSILAGVVLSAAVGGSVIQWSNDYLVAPFAKKWLSKHYKNDNTKPAPITPSIPSQRTFGMASAQSMQPTAPAAHPSQAVMQPGLDLVSPAVPMRPFMPVYLPNPKMQPPPSAFAMNSFAFPQPTMPNPWGGA